jgi:hypothetical protein
VALAPQLHVSEEITENLCNSPFASVSIALLRTATSRGNVMGSRLVEFPVAGGKVLVEVDDPAVGTRPVSRSAIERAKESFETAVAQVKPGVEALMEQLRGLSRKPDQVSLEFGIKFTAEADALIAKSSLEGNIKVTLSWAEHGE